MAASMFTLSPANHPSLEELVANPGKHCWATFRRNKNIIEVRTNIVRPVDSPFPKNGGQTWRAIAQRCNRSKVWGVLFVSQNETYDISLLVSYLQSKGEKVKVSDLTLIPISPVKRYRATIKCYSLVTILNGGRPARNKDKDADERRRRCGSVDFMAEMLKRTQK